MPKPMTEPWSDIPDIIPDIPGQYRTLFPDTIGHYTGHRPDSTGQLPGHYVAEAALLPRSVHNLSRSRACLCGGTDVSVAFSSI